MKIWIWKSIDQVKPQISVDTTRKYNHTRIIEYNSNHKLQFIQPAAWQQAAASTYEEPPAVRPTNNPAASSKQQVGLAIWENTLYEKTTWKYYGRITWQHEETPHLITWHEKAAWIVLQSSYISINDGRIRIILITIIMLRVGSINKQK
jgi:hypothetical protein